MTKEELREVIKTEIKENVYITEEGHLAGMGNAAEAIMGIVVAKEAQWYKRGLVMGDVTLAEAVCDE
jgi:hypothetical protein